MPDFKEIDYAEAKHLSNALYLMESKIDGTCMKWINATGELISERGCVRNDRFPHIVKDLQLLGRDVQGEVAIPFGNVLDLNRDTWKKANFYAFDALDVDDAPEAKRKELKRMLRANKGLTHLKIPFKWDNFDKAWGWVKRHGVEGLVFKSLLGGKDYKLKDWKEAKLQVVGHVAGKQKGSFQIKNVNGSVSGISATSVGYVQKYNQLIAAGKEVWIELQYLFLTCDGKPFQPRIRLLDEKKEILWKQAG